MLILIGLGLFGLELFVASYGLLTVGGAIALILGAAALYTGVDGTDAISSSTRSSSASRSSSPGSRAGCAGAVEVRRRPAPTQPMLALVGAAGTAETPIAPTGIAHAQGETWTARSRHGSIRPGRRSAWSALTDSN